MICTNSYVLVFSLANLQANYALTLVSLAGTDNTALLLAGMT
jgi:hypothetical protein